MYAHHGPVNVKQETMCIIIERLSTLNNERLAQDLRAAYSDKNIGVSSQRN